MPFRFFRRVRIAPGLTLNFSKRGASLSLGGRGAKMTFGTSGVTSTVGIPGTGLFYTSHARRRSGPIGSRRRSRVFEAPGHESIEVPSKAESVRQLAMRDPSLGGTLGQRENDELFKELIADGPKTVTMNTQEAKEWLSKLKADSRLKMTDPAGRRISIAALEAKIQKMELQEQIEESRKQIEEDEAEYEELLNMWRDLPAIPNSEEVAAALKMKGFRTDLQQPPPPDLEEKKQSLIESVQCDLSSKLPYSLLPAFVGKAKTKTMADEVWSSRRVEIQNSYNETVRRYESELEKTEAAWRDQENARIGKLQRLVDCDLVEMHNTAVEVTLAIKFPFDTWCDVYLNDASKIFVSLDLPEIEDVIPSHKQRPLKSGEIGEVRIDESSRNQDYFQLIVGQAVLIAAHLFADLPSIALVTIAAYTQRLRKKRLDDIDAYVFEIAFPKDFIESFDTDVDDLLPLIRQLSPIMSLDTKWGLERIERPAWVQEPQ